MGAHTGMLEFGYGRQPVRSTKTEPVDQAPDAITIEWGWLIFFVLLAGLLNWLI